MANLQADWRLLITVTVNISILISISLANETDNIGNSTYDEQLDEENFQNITDIPNVNLELNVPQPVACKLNISLTLYQPDQQPDQLFSMTQTNYSSSFENYWKRIYNTFRRNPFETAVTLMLLLLMTGFGVIRLIPSKNIIDFIKTLDNTSIYSVTDTTHVCNELNKIYALLAIVIVLQLIAIGLCYRQFRKNNKTRTHPINKSKLVSSINSLPPSSFFIPSKSLAAPPRKSCLPTLSSQRRHLKKPKPKPKPNNKSYSNWIATLRITKVPNNDQPKSNQFSVMPNSDVHWLNEENQNKVYYAEKPKPNKNNHNQISTFPNSDVHWLNEGNQNKVYYAEKPKPNHNQTSTFPTSDVRWLTSNVQNKAHYAESPTSNLHPQTSAFPTSDANWLTINNDTSPNKTFYGKQPKTTNHHHHQIPNSPNSPNSAVFSPGIFRGFPPYPH